MEWVGLEPQCLILVPCLLPAGACAGFGLAVETLVPYVSFCWDGVLQLLNGEENCGGCLGKKEKKSELYEKKKEIFE